MGTITQHEDLLDRIKSLEDKVAALQRGQTLNGAVISNGALEVRNPSNGNTLLQAGEFTYGSQQVYGISMFRNDGSPTFRSWDTSSGNGWIAMIDEAGNIVMSTDTTSGQGLATPWIPMEITRWADVVTPPQSTTSASWEGMYRIHGQKQHPFAYVILITKTSAGTTGDVRLSVNGTMIGSALSVPSGDFSYRDITAAMPGDHLSEMFIDVEGCRTSGSGSLSVTTVYAMGVQS